MSLLGNKKSASVEYPPRFSGRHKILKNDCLVGRTKCSALRGHTLATCPLPPPLATFLNLWILGSTPGQHAYAPCDATDTWAGNQAQSLGPKGGRGRGGNGACNLGLALTHSHVRGPLPWNVSFSSSQRWHKQQI